MLDALARQAGVAGGFASLKPRAPSIRSRSR